MWGRGKGNKLHRACPPSALQQRKVLGQLRMSQPLSLELQLSLWMDTKCTSLVTLWMLSSLLFAPLHRSACPLASCAMLAFMLF